MVSLAVAMLRQPAVRSDSDNIPSLMYQVYDVRMRKVNNYL